MSTSITATAEPASGVPAGLTGTFHADQAHSTFQFTVRHMKVAKFSASFDDSTATVVAGDDGVRLDGRAKVESVTIKSPQDFRDHVVYGADFFDAANHPEISFSSADVRLADDGTATVHGELTIKGVTKPFTATGSYEGPAEDPWGGVHVAAELSATVDRRDWGLDFQAELPKGGNVLGWDVELAVQAEFIQEA